MQDPTQSPDLQYSFAKDKIRIVLLEGIHPSAVEHFASKGYTNVGYFDRALDPEELADVIAEAHMIGVRSRTQLWGDVLDRAERLMAIGCFCIGTNQVDLDATRDHGVPVFNAPHSNTRSVAELVLAEAVWLLRGLSDKNRGAHEGRWLKSAAASYELRGKTIGIVGYGHIGSQVSILAEAFGLRVQYFDVEPKLAMGNAQPAPTLEALLGSVDIVTLHVPAAPDTVNMMGPEQIRAMKPGAYLINASRGNVVDIDALGAALDEGHVAGAAVDVFPAEPKQVGERFTSPLQGKSNVVLTPHIGGSTKEAQHNIGVEVATKLCQYSDLGVTLGAVNFPALSLPVHRAGSHRILHIHENKPGVLGEVNRMVAETDANIIGQYLETLPQVGYAVTDIVCDDTKALRDRLFAIPGTLRCRFLY